MFNINRLMKGVAEVGAVAKDLALLVLSLCVLIVFYSVFIGG